MDEVGAQPPEHDHYHEALKEGPLTQQLEVLLGQQSDLQGSCVRESSMRDRWVLLLGAFQTLWPWDSG